MNRRLRWTSFAAAAILAIALVSVFSACGGDDDTSDPPPAPSSSPTSAGTTGSGTPQSELGKKINAARIPEDRAEGTRLGAADARVVVEAYEDFGCPHCLDFTALIEPALMTEYVATGKIAFVYRFFPLRQLTAGAAIAAYCAGEQNKFWPYHRSLFIAQAEANEKKGPTVTEAFAPTNLKKLAADLGLDAPKFETCLTSDAATAAVQADLKAANGLALPGTPSFVINGKVTPTPESIADWRKLLDGLLK